MPDEPVDLPVGYRVRIVPEPAVAPAQDASHPLLGLLAALERLPSDPDAPVDGAAQHDHYLYGTPKRP